MIERRAKYVPVEHVLSRLIVVVVVVVEVVIMVVVGLSSLVL